MKLFTKSVLSSLFLSFALSLSACGQSNPDENPVCGNGTIEDGEQCDDGDKLSGDGCSFDCQIEEDECGDNTLDAGEQCDDGNQLSGDGCSSACNLEGPSEAEQINEYILGLGELPPVSQSETQNSPPVTVQDGDYECTAQNLTAIEPISQVSVLQDGTVGIFPGELLRGDSLDGNGFTEAAFERKPMTYTLNLLDGAAGPRSATMQNPSFADFFDSMGGILETVNLDGVPISAAFDIQEVRSEQELQFELGVTVNSPQFDVAGQFNFEDLSKRSRYLVTMDIKFFDAIAEPFVDPSDAFADTVTQSEVAQKFSDGNPPVYISSLSYGTRIYFAVESSFDSQELNAALEASFKGTAVQADGETSLSNKEVLNSSSISFVGIGLGTAQRDALTAALGAVDKFQAIRTFVATPQLFSAANIGAPIAFQMKHLADNQPAAFGLSGTFDVEACIRVSQNIRVTLKTIKATNIIEETGQGQGALEVFGVIQAKSLDTGASAGNIFSVSSTIPQSLAEGTDVTFGGVQNQVILSIKPEEAKNLRLTFNLDDQDGVGSNDDLLNFVTQDIFFLDGFNTPRTLTFNTVGGTLTFVIEFTPVL